MLEILVGVVEDDVGLVLDGREVAGDLVLERLDGRIGAGGVGLERVCVGGIRLAQDARDFRQHLAGVLRIEPDMAIARGIAIARGVGGVVAVVMSVIVIMIVAGRALVVVIVRVIVPRVAVAIFVIMAVMAMIMGVIVRLERVAGAHR